MRFRLSMTAAALVALMTTCTVRSLYPLYTSKDVVFKPALLGIWAEQKDPDKNWVFQKSGDNGCRLISSEGMRVLEGRLIKLGGQMFLDVTPKKEDVELSIPAHLFVRIELSGNTLWIALLSSDWVKKAAESETLGLSNLLVDSGLVLTAPTNELQAFVARHAGDAAVFDKPEEYRRVAASLESGL